MDVLRQTLPGGSQPLEVTGWGPTSLGATRQGFLMGWKLLHTLLACEPKHKWLQATQESLGGTQIVPEGPSSASSGDIGYWEGPPFSDCDKDSRGGAGLRGGRAQFYFVCTETEASRYSQAAQCRADQSWSYFSEAPK